MTGLRNGYVIVGFRVIGFRSIDSTVNALLIVMLNRFSHLEFQTLIDVFGIVVDATQSEDLHLEELAEFGLDLLFFRASTQTVVQVFH